MNIFVRGRVIICRCGSVVVSTVCCVRGGSGTKSRGTAGSLEG